MKVRAFVKQIEASEFKMKTAKKLEFFIQTNGEHSSFILINWVQSLLDAIQCTVDGLRAMRFIFWLILILLHVFVANSVDY